MASVVIYQVWGVFTVPRRGENSLSVSSIFLARIMPLLLPPSLPWLSTGWMIWLMISKKSFRSIYCLATLTNSGLSDSRRLIRPTLSQRSFGEYRRSESVITCFSFRISSMIFLREGEVLWIALISE